MSLWLNSSYKDQTFQKESEFWSTVNNEPFSTGDCAEPTRPIKARQAEEASLEASPRDGRILTWVPESNQWGNALLFSLLFPINFNEQSTGHTDA